MRVLALSVFLALLTACSEYAPGMDESMDLDDSDFPADNNGDTGDSDDHQETPTLFAIEGSLTVASGEVTQTALEVSFWTADSTHVCTQALASDLATPETLNDPSLAMYGWWEFTFSDALPTDTGVPVRTECPWPNPSPVLLGIGEPDTRLYAAATAAGLPSDTTNALYLGINQTVFVYGLAGTEDQFTGVSTVIETSPVPDGTYRLEALHLLSL
jgi:hypothetical protein